MKVTLYMTVWKNAEPRFLCASAQCPARYGDTSVVLAFDVDIPDYYLRELPDHTIAPATNLKEIK